MTPKPVYTSEGPKRVHTKVRTKRARALRRLTTEGRAEQDALDRARFLARLAREQEALSVVEGPELPDMLGDRCYRFSAARADIRAFYSQQQEKTLTYKIAYTWDEVSQLKGFPYQCKSGPHWHRTSRPTKSTS